MEESIIKYSNIIGADDTFDIIFANIDELKKELVDLTKLAKKELSLVNPNDEKTLSELVKRVNDLAKAKNALDKEEKMAVKTKKKLNELTDEELIQREKEKVANRERVQRAKQLAIIRREEKDTIASLRAQLSLVTLNWKKLTIEEQKNSVEGKELARRKKELTERLKAVERATGDARRNVGNYTDSLGRLGKVAARVFIGRSIVDGLKRIGSFFTGLIDKNKEFNSTLKGVGESFDGVSNALEFAGTKILTFLAPAIEFVAGLLADLPAFFAGLGAGIAQFVSNTTAGFRNLGDRIAIFGPEGKKGR